LKGKKRGQGARLASNQVTWEELKNSVSANLISSHNAAPATLNDPAIGGVRRAGPCADGLLGADERCAEQDDRSQCDVEPPRVVATSAGAFAPALVTLRFPQSTSAPANPKPMHFPSPQEWLTVELRNSCGAEIGCAAVPTIDSIIPLTQRSVVTQLQLSSTISAGICI
jgi:hypothetical protein